MFNPLEVENGPASREMRYKIQKWNVRSNVVHGSTGCRWMILTLPSSLKSSGKESYGMFAHNVRLRHGKVCNLKD